MEKKWSHFSLEPHLRILRFGGYCALDASSPPKRLYVHKMYMRFVLFAAIIFMIQHAIRIYEVRNDMNTLMDTMFLLFAYLGSIYKQIVMLVKQNDVQELLNTMKGDLFNQPEEKHQKLLKSTAREAKIIVRIYSLTSIVTSFLMALYLYILHVQGTHVEFSVWFPFEPNTKLKFYFTLLYDYIQMAWIAFNITTLDAFIAFFLQQCTTQINILGFFTKIEATFSGAVFCQFLFGGWILCTTAYRLVEIDKTSLPCLTIILFLMCIFAELFLFCFYGSKLTDASVKLMDSAYFLDWLEMPKKNRRDLLLFMEMIKKPIMPTAGSIAPLANTTFVSIVKSSYSFYAFLKNMEN
ncbi:odorant receptor 94b-like [Papilio machaon]|uniref:odorant receptor 94b-like n=1 Tax=Papilio machaon TaxID=76193 RepID=UPI001E663891|nr:odorant receptor 94b-like [Papilio machaon]